MGEISSRRHLRAVAAVSFAVLAASCSGGRNGAAPVVMNGATMNGPGPERIDTAPIAPLAGGPMTSPRHGPASRPPASPSGPGLRVVVRPGMSVRYLAHLYGVSRQAIIDANHLAPPEYKIEIGKAVVIPGATEERGPVQAAAAEKPAAPEHAPAVRRAAKAGEVIPLDDPAPAPRQTAAVQGRESQANSLSPPAASAQRSRPEGRLSPPAAERARPPAEPADEEDVAAEAEPPAKGGGHFPWPVRGRVLAGYGATKDGGHNAGINIAAARGAPVRAVEGGTVAYAGNEIRGYGNLVLVKHPDGFISAYAHLDSLLVKRGDSVSRGQVIAKVGTTGGVSEPQLHFELRRGKSAVDPREFLGPGANAGNGKGTEG